MSTKISALPERAQSDIIGDEFFPIIDGGTDSTTAITGYQTYKIKLDTLFASTQGYEKVTGLVVTEGELLNSGTNPSNEFFTLEYTQEDNTVQTLRIQKYAIQANDVAFNHIDPAGYITSTQRISSNISDSKLATASAVDEHIIHKEDLLFNNPDSAIKEYYGDSTTSRTDGSHILKDFKLVTEVAEDFSNLQDGASDITTFKKVEERFDLVDYSDKIGVSQVNVNHFRIDLTNPNKRLNIKDSGITANLISVNAVTTDKINSKNVTRAKIADQAISNGQIADATITAAKIADATIDHGKLSRGSPQWTTRTVSIPNVLNVADSITAADNITSNGTEFKLYNEGRAGTNVHEGRALVHNVGDRLHINYAGDYTGGVTVRGIVTVPDQNAAAINAGGDRSVVTKEYVDAADILVNPIGGDRIQDDAIGLNHMRNDSVGTLEILDDSITSAKIENIGPQWNTTGDVVVSGKLTADGQTFTLGSNAKPSGNVTLSLLASGSGSATITRKTGTSGSLLINNAGGSIDLSPGSGTSTKLQVSSSKSTLSNPLHITGAGSSTINGTNFTNPALLVGSSTYGIAIDSNEIVQKGDQLYLGVSDGAKQSIYFREGANTIATIHGNAGHIQAGGDFITNTGIIRSATSSSRLLLRGGGSDNGGADIELYNSSHQFHPGYAYYDADRHTFRSQDNSKIALTIDSLARKVTLHAEGTSANHLVTKGYVDKNAFPKITTRDDITTRMDSGFYQTASASTAEGWPEDRGYYHLLTNTHSNTNNYHALQFAASFHDQEVYFRSTQDKGDREWNKLWHANNVGSGSGLDADKLDGKEATEFSLAVHKHDNLYRKLSGKIAYTDLTTGGPLWSDNGIVHTTNALFVQSSADDYRRDSVGVYTRNIYGREGRTDLNQKSKLRLKGGNAAGDATIQLYASDHDNQSEIEIIGKQTQVKTITGGLALDIQEDGKIVAPLQTKTRITSNPKSLTTKEYVTDEIAKVFPDDNYIPKTGGSVDGDLYFRNDAGNLTGKGITWLSNSDSASIRFYNTSDGDTDCHLEFRTSDNENEYFLFTHKPHLSEKIDLLKISTSEISYKGVSLMTEIATDQVVSASIKNNAVTSSKIASGQITAAKIATDAVTTTKIGDNQVTEAKLADVTPGYVLGRGPTEISGPNLVAIDNDLTSTSYNVVASGQAVKDYTDLKVAQTRDGMATVAYADAIITKMYPVGVIYTSTSSANPRTFFGFGTWQSFGAGRVLVGVNSSDPDFNSANKMGGTKGHTLTIDQMPSHRHVGGAGDIGSNVFAHGTISGEANSSINTVSGDSDTLGYTTYTGGGAAHNNLQPYITVYMWTRTA